MSIKVCCSEIRSFAARSRSHVFCFKDTTVLEGFAPSPMFGGKDGRLRAAGTRPDERTAAMPTGRTGWGGVRQHTRLSCRGVLYPAT